MSLTRLFVGLDYFFVGGVWNFGIVNFVYIGGGGGAFVFVCVLCESVADLGVAH